MLPLKVLAIIPLYNWVFQLTYPISVTEYLEHSISHSPLFAIVAISQYIINRRLSQKRRKPLNGVNVYHSLHIEQIDSNLNSIPMAYLIYRLYIRPIDQLANLHVIELYWVLNLLKLLLLFLFVFVHPKDSGSSFSNDVHFVVGAEIGLWVTTLDGIAADSSLLAVGWYV